ncbi:MAG: signal peptide peptidase SppA [Verrucomicrobia bacterium]|nr:signal peptide peptidase SppA [Verrucomicrobiota bacterium]
MQNDEQMNNQMSDGGSPPPVPPVVPTPPRLSAPPPVSTPARQKKSRRTWVYVVLGFLAILVLIVVIGLGQIMSGFVTFGGIEELESGPALREVMIENNHADAKLAVVDIQGIIGSAYFTGDEYDIAELVRRQLKRAEQDRRIRGVILRIDSPGGEVLAADEISRHIAEFQKRTGKPVVASMGSLAASGGYYVAAPCRWIVAHELTLTGSIGVLMNGYNYRGLMNKVGVRPEVYKSGRFKDMMSPTRADEEIHPEERKMLQTLVDECYERFKKVVADGRNNANRLNDSDGRTLASNWAEYADGRVFSGKQAYELGFVDELGNFKTAVARALKLTDLDRANLVQFRQPADFFRLLRLFGKTETRALKIDLGVELPRLQPGRLYFLFLPGIP